MHTEARADGIGARHAIRDWRSEETAKVRRGVAETSRVLRLELESEITKLGRFGALRSDASIFSRWIEQTGKPGFDALAQRLLSEAGQDLREATGVDVGGPNQAESRLSSLLRPLGVAPEVAVPAVGIGIGLYIVFALAITTASSFYFFTTTTVDPRVLLGGVVVVSLSAYLLLSSPTRVLRRKRDKILARYDKFVAEAIAPGNSAPDAEGLEPRLIAAIRRRADELEAELTDA